MSFLQRFLSLFPGGEMQQTLGNGTITEAGGVLTVEAASGVDCDWATDVAPLAWVPVHDKISAFDTVFKLDTRLYSYSTTGGTTSRAGAVFYKDYNNGYEFGYYAGDGKIYVTRWMAGSGGKVAETGSAVTVPTTSPHTYRIYWNPTARPLFVQEETEGLSFTITANEVQFWYRIGDAGTWTRLHSRTWEWLPQDTHYGLCAHNYAATKHGVTALFSYAGVYQWNATSQIYVPANDPVPLTDTSVDPKVVVSLEDRTETLTQSGPAGYQWSDGQGDGRYVAEFPVALEDQAQLLPLSGQLTHSMRDALDQGYSFRSPAAVLEDRAVADLSGEPEFSTATVDSYGHAHFLYPKPYLMFVYEASGEPWDTPTLNSFTGYGRDGYKYTGGVQDAGPVSAPWRTEASGVDRSGRVDFPLKSLIVVTRLELVIFDLDNYTGAVTSMHVWMRFRLGNSSSDFYALGRGYETIRSVVMANGQLVVGTTNTGWEGGRIHSVDFKATTPATTFSLLGGWGQWIGQGTKSVVDRNTNSIWASSGSYRINPEENHSLSHLMEAPNTLYVALSGEDESPQIVKYTGGVVQSVITAVGPDIGDNNVGDYRRVLLDERGWLWFAIGSRIYRNVFDWQEGYMFPRANDTRQGTVDLGHTILHLVQMGNDLYAGTEVGVFRVNKGTLSYYLAYTAAGGGGGGRLNAPPAGELIPGGSLYVQSLKGQQFLFFGVVVKYLSIGTYFDQEHVGAACTIRLFDDEVVETLEFPALIEPGVFVIGAVGM